MIPQTLTELVTALTALTGRPPLERARTAPGLIEAAKNVLATVRGQALHEACTHDGWTIPALARELGVHRSKIDDSLARARATAVINGPAPGKHPTAGTTQHPAPTPPPPPQTPRTVDLSGQLGSGWQLLAHHDAPGQNAWQLQHHTATVGIVRRDATTTGRRGWRASINGILLPAHGHLAVAAGPLWRTRDLAAAGIVHHLQTHPPRPGNGLARRPDPQPPASTGHDARPRPR